MSKTANATKVERKKFLLEGVRLSYPNLFTARAMEGDDNKKQKPQYSASFILDKKKHRGIIAEIEAEAKKLAIAKWGKVPVKFRGPVRDGSTFVDQETDEPKDGYGDDVVAINAKSLARPQCVDRNRNAADEEMLYGGCYVNAVITLYTWEHPKNGKGVSANLGPVQFFKNGERFGGAVIDPDEVFEDLGEDDEGEDEKPKKKKSRPADDDDDDPTADL